MNQFRYIVFDLGGVVVDWDGIDTLLELTGDRMTAEGARRFWLESGSVRAFEAGKCGPDEYARGVVKELDLQIAPDEFLAKFESWDRGPLPGALELLHALSKKYPLACLSNNNPIHWAAHRRLGVLEPFQRLFPSFETGFVKPDRDAFLNVIQKLQVPPGSLLFFDDNPECIEAASKTGMTARLAKGVDAVRQGLSGLKIAF
ncbi:HAD family phosphatase [bacterium]|nr:HAD family phosphatase [bacterium]